jgi:DNA-binding NarL/FixJ family response regulator
MCVDDNRLIVDALRSLIKKEAGMFWAGAVTDGMLALEHIIATRPDIVLFDVDQPGVDTFLAVEEVGARSPGTRVVMFSGHVVPRYIERALDCGAWGYLSKSDAASEIIAALRRVASGEIVFSSEVRNVMHKSEQRPRDGNP